MKGKANRKFVPTWCTLASFLSFYFIFFFFFFFGLAFLLLFLGLLLFVYACSHDSRNSLLALGMHNCLKNFRCTLTFSRFFFKKNIWDNSYVLARILFVYINYIGLGLLGKLRCSGYDNERSRD